MIRAILIILVWGGLCSGTGFAAGYGLGVLGGWVADRWHQAQKKPGARPG